MGRTLAPIQRNGPWLHEHTLLTREFGTCGLQISHSYGNREVVVKFFSQNDGSMVAVSNAANILGDLEFKMLTFVLIIELLYRELGKEWVNSEIDSL